MEWKNDADWMATVDENLRMGFVEILVLHMLTEKDMYGYEIRKALAERTNNAFQFGESSLYIPLLRMASRGLVSSRKEYAVGKRFRTYYHIEDLGKKYLAYGREQCEFLFSGINNLFNWEDVQNEK